MTKPSDHGDRSGGLLIGYVGMIIVPVASRQLPMEMAIRRKFCMTRKNVFVPDDGMDRIQMPCVMSMMITVHWKRKPIW